jgi:hypothetical protein
MNALGILMGDATGALQTIPEDAFLAEVAKAATTGEHLCLTGRRVIISKPIKLARSEALHIVGGTLVRISTNYSLLPHYLAV